MIVWNTAWHLGGGAPSDLPNFAKTVLSIHPCTRLSWRAGSEGAVWCPDITRVHQQTTTVPCSAIFIWSPFTATKFGVIPTIRNNP